MSLIIWFVLIFIFLVLVLLLGIKIIRPTHRAVIETFGKYSRFGKSGFNFVIPIIQRLISINVTEQVTNIEPQEIITKDNLNAKVDLVIYYKIQNDEENVKKALYNVDDVSAQLETLSRTTARNVIGTMQFKEVNSERDKLNVKLQTILLRETKNWGVSVLKVELKEIVPPRDVQETMNKVIKAENEKTAAIDLATARETEADGLRRASIKNAEGDKMAKILRAEGEAKSIQIINEAANKYFVGNAQRLKTLEVTQASLQNNSKVVLTKEGITPQLILGELPIITKNIGVSK